MIRAKPGLRIRAWVRVKKRAVRMPTSGNNSRIAEIVSFARIWNESSFKDRHPIYIDTEGWLFDGPIRKTHTKRARSLGRQVYQRFTALVEATRPIYAAMTVTPSGWTASSICTRTP